MSSLIYEVPLSGVEYPPRDLEPSYQPYVQSLIDAGKAGVGSCVSQARAMCAEFPMLRFRRGVVKLASGRSSEHAWCVYLNAPYVVDPTASQFDTEHYSFGPASKIVMYCEMDESRAHEVPIGRCMNCGDGVYIGAPCSIVCSQDCQDEIDEDMKAERNVREVMRHV